MDPASAISLVSAILSFIDYAHKVATGANELYNSVTGATDSNTNIEIIIKDLDEAATDLGDVDSKTKHAKALNSLAAKCKKIADDLLRLLETLSVSGKRSTWKVVRVAIRNLRKEGEVARIVTRLGEYRSQILLQLSLMLNDQQCSIRVQLDKLENKELSFSTESAALLSKLREDILKDVTQLREKVNQATPAETDPNEVRDGILQVQELLKNLSSMMMAVPKENVILRSIFFSSMHSREENMDSAGEGTFDWIFEEEKVISTQAENELEDGSSPRSSSDSSVGAGTSASGDSDIGTGSNMDNSPENSRPPSRGPSKEALDPEERYRMLRNEKLHEQELERRLTARTNFTTWLKEGGGIFHISGKAGSGKSTLMKFLCSHERTKEGLQVWAGKDKKAAFARFYFWKSSGDNFQMSLSGLHRSILFETLKYCPYLIPELFQRQWEMLSNNVPYVPGDFIRNKDAQNAFEALTAKGSFPQHRFCFFLDGLDEYQGQWTDHVKLVGDLQRWAGGGDVKICASSRPYLQFDKLVASEDRRIHLHELTRHDIYLFSRKMIEDTLKDDLEYVRGYYLSLVEKVVKKSEGVFLWARLVICSLLEGMSRHDKEEVLEHKLEVSPPDINGLYIELLNTLSPDDRVRAEKMMLLTAHYPFMTPLRSVVYAFIDQLSEPNFPPLDGKKPISWGTAKETADDVHLQLKSLTKGLLEPAPLKDRLGNQDGRYFVQFFHQSVRDFVLENSKLDDTARIFQHLTELETYYRLWLAELILEDHPTRTLVWERTYYETLNSFRLSSPRDLRGLPFDLLEGFSRVVDKEDIISKPEIDVDSDHVFNGCKSGTNIWYPDGKALFTCLAACNGQLEYVLQKVAKKPELLRGNGESHVLLSAARNDRVDLVRALLQQGSSPLDCVSGDLYARKPVFAEGTEFEAIPIWMVFLVHLVGWRLLPRFAGKERYQILELLLQDQHVDPTNCWFLLSKDESTPGTHFITLEQFIRDDQPDNMDQLLALLRRGNRSSYVNTATNLLSKLSPFYKQKKPALDKETSGYIPFRLDKERDVKSKMYCKVGICGDLRIDGRVVIKLF